MALSAQNQSTSYVNLYYSFVQRAATRYFKEYYNSGEYLRRRKHIPFFVWTQDPRPRRLPAIATRSPFKRPLPSDPPSRTTPTHPAWFVLQNNPNETGDGYTLSLTRARLWIFPPSPRRNSPLPLRRYRCGGATLQLVCNCLQLCQPTSLPICLHAATTHVCQLDYVYVPTLPRHVPPSLSFFSCTIAIDACPVAGSRPWFTPWIKHC